jgi:hypothetical protein
MELKKGVWYDAIHKTQTYFDPELKREMRKSMILKITEKGRMYHNILIKEICGEEIRKNDYIVGEQWDFYEIRDKENETYSRNCEDVLAAQALAVELDCKNLFDSYGRDLKYLGYKGEKVG